MPAPANLPGAADYRQALLSARSTGFALAREADEFIRQVYAEMLRSLLADEAAGINPARAQALRRQVEALLRRFERQFTENLDKNLTLTMERIVTLHDEATAALLHRHRGDLRAGFALNMASIEPRVLAVTAAIRRAPTFRSLLNYRIEREALPQVDRFLTAAVARGVSVQQTTLDLARMMAGDSGALRQALSRLPPHFSTVTRPLGLVDFRRYGVDPSQTQALRTLLYDARRIARSETGNVARETNAISMVQSPVVQGARWQLSGAHPEEDECDYLAEVDLYGLGPGVHPPDRWPLAPHPQDKCYQGGPMVFRHPSDWGTPKPPSTGPVIDPTDNETLRGLAARYNWSPARLEAAQRTIQGSVSDQGIIRLRQGFGPVRGNAPRPRAPRPVAVPPAPILPAIFGMLENAADALRTAIARPRFGPNKSVKPVMEDIGDAMGARATAYHASQASNDSYGWFDETDGSVHLSRDQAERIRNLGTVMERPGWSGLTLEQATARADAILNDYQQPLSLRGEAGAVRDGLHAVRTIIHEHLHVLSSKISSIRADYIAPLGHWLEEGLVEYRSREIMARLMYNEGYEASRARPLAKIWSSYDSYMPSMRFLSQHVGWQAVEDMFAAAGRYNRANVMLDRMGPYVDDLVRRAGLDPVYAGRLRRALEPIPLPPDMPATWPPPMSWAEALKRTADAEARVMEFMKTFPMLSHVEALITAGDLSEARRQITRLLQTIGL